MIRKIKSCCHFIWQAIVDKKIQLKLSAWLAIEEARFIKIVPARVFHRDRNPVFQA
jgi:hypothetical protein